jgi:hypothetical protein
MRERCHRCGGYITRISGYNAGTCEAPDWREDEVYHDDPDDAEFCRLLADPKENER